MTAARRGSTVESKVGDLLGLTSGLSVSQLLVLRRMTLLDSAKSAWASERDLEMVFRTILDRALSKLGAAALSAAAKVNFAPLLPPGTAEQASVERKLLYELARKHLLPAKPSVKSAPPSAEDDSEAEIVFSSFKQLFDECLSRYARRTLQAIVVAPGHASLRPHVKVPFLLAPGFAACFETLLRRHVLPDLRTARRIRELENRRDWRDNGANRLIGILQSGERDNPILSTWDGRWASYSAAGIGAETKGEDDPWTLLAEAADKGGYTAPTEADLPLLQAVIRWDEEVLKQAWRGITLLYQQEFAPQSRADQAREGALRDGLLRAIRDLPERAGETLAIKAFFELPKCDRMFLRRLLQTLSGSDAARRQAAPGLTRFYDNLPQ